MKNWQQAFTVFASDAETTFDRLKYKLTQRLGSDDPLKILPYRGYGLPQRLYLKGRVLEEEGIAPSTDNDSLWQNLLNTYRRVESDEVPHALVRARFQDAVQEVTADEEGFFEIWLEPTAPAPPDCLWHQVELELLYPAPEEGQPPVRATGQVLVPPPGARFAIISDIDDTVLQSHVTQLLRMAQTLFLGNARTRLPFPGVAAFYQALIRGAGAGSPNPLFFVSSSPWNLYDLLMEFFELQEIPRAPTFLRDWGVTRREILPTENRAHKMDVIRQVLEFYEDLPFILIGDSGQQDPEIYHEIVHDYPGRVLAVYIRNVTEDLERPEAIKKLIREVADSESTLILADNTLVMAEHAAGEGWIDPESLSSIATEVEADQAEPSALEEALGEDEEAPTIIIEGKKEENR